MHLYTFTDRNYLNRFGFTPFVVLLILFISHFDSCVSTCRLTLGIGDSLPSFPKIKPETQEAKSGAHFATGTGGARQEEGGSLKPCVWTIDPLIINYAVIFKNSWNVHPAYIFYTNN